MRTARHHSLRARAARAAILLGGGLALLWPFAVPPAGADACPALAAPAQDGAPSMSFNIADLLAQLQAAQAAAAAAGSSLYLQSTTADGSTQMALQLTTSTGNVNLCLTVTDTQGNGIAGVAIDGVVTLTVAGEQQVSGFPETDSAGQSFVSVPFDPAAGPVLVTVQVRAEGASLDATTMLGG